MEPSYYWHSYSTWYARDILTHVDEAMIVVSEAMDLCRHSAAAPYHVVMSLYEQKDRKAQLLQEWVAKLDLFIDSANEEIESLTERSRNDELEVGAYQKIIEERGQHEEARSGLRAKIRECKDLLQRAETMEAPAL